MNQFRRFAAGLVFSAGVFLFAGEKVSPQRTEVVRIEMESITEMSAAVSRLGNCVAPNFKDTVALFTVALTLGGSSFGMDLTRPVSIVFYEVGKNPSMRITSHAIPNVQVIQKSARLWNIKFHARLKNGLVTLFTDDLLNDPTSASVPGKKLSDSILALEASPEKIRKHFSFRSLTTKNERYRLLFQALDELMSEVDTLGVSFRADDNLLYVKLSASARKNSALEKYLAKPLPEKGPIEAFEGADSLAILRLVPNKALCRYGSAYLFRTGEALFPALPSAVTGFAVFSSGTDVVHTSAKLVLGIRPDHAGEIAKSAAGMGYTPYPNLFQVMRNPPLFCSASGPRFTFYFSDALLKTDLERLLKPTAPSLTVNQEVPFAFYALSNPAKPIVELRFKGNRAQMIFQASDEWFATLQPLVDIPLHKIGTETP